MITLRLSIDEVNTIYGSLETARDEAHTHTMDINQVQLLMDKVKSMTEKDASTWDGYVTNEVNTVLELFLPEASAGNVGIKYERAKVAGDSGEFVEVEDKAEAVSVNIILDFTEPIDISHL